ncbi:MAG: type II toxin-antitoxin system HicB family antitoxin [Dehalogenimonas sp.]
MLGMPKKKTSHSMVIEIEICIEPDEDGYLVYCPALKGLHSWGSTVEEAKQNIHSASIAYLQSMAKHGDPLPIGIIKKHESDDPDKTGCYTENMSLALA